MNKITKILEKPHQALSIWSAYHLVVWTFLPLVCNTCLPLDSIEAVMWGSQWQWGYDKHPPMSAWMPELFTVLMGDAGLYLLSQLCIVLAGLGIYRLGRLLKLTARQAMVAILLLDTIYYYQFISVEFNVNIMQLPFWAWAWYFGIDAVQNKRFGSWLGLGALLIGMFAIPGTAIVNFLIVRNSSQASADVALVKCWLAALIAPFFILGFFLFA